MNHLKIGCIADDFTGASDAASYLRLGGLNTLLVNGVPRKPLPEGVQAVVAALKTRTIPASEAVAQSEAAARWLLKQGAQQLYFKYCSTFDSTEKGNIGPVTDMLLELTGSRCTIVCPALPDNGRIVRRGVLYVNGVPLAESPMRNHPLTPMRESSVMKLMGMQSRYPCHYFRKDGDLSAFAGERFTLVPDYENEQDARRIADAFGHLPLLTGGSGILRALAKRAGGGTPPKTVAQSAGTDSRCVVLSGSCSEMTRRQVKAWLDAGRRALRIDADALLQGSQTIESLCDALRLPGDVLIYSTADPDSVKRSQRHGAEKVSALLEQAMARLACEAVRLGVRRLIIAGGETSSAALQRLDFDQFSVGESLAPGVPVLTPIDHPDLRLVLKSGNFGDENFFINGVPEQ